MEFIQEFFSEYPELATLIYDGIKGIIFLIGVIVYKRTGNKKIMEVAETMPKFKTEQTALGCGKGLTCDKFVKTYRLNKVTGELEEDGQLDMHEVVQSCKDQTLNAVMERFFPEQANDNLIVEHMGLVDDLDIAFNLQEKLEAYREHYSLPSNYSNAQIIDFMKQKSTELANIIKEKEVLKDEKKKEIIEESK